MHPLRLVAIFVSVLSFLIAPGAVAQEATTTVTYQGRMDSGGQPFTGTADIRVQLFRLNLPVSTPLTRFGVSVVDGVFSIPLDFGPEVATFGGFSGSLGQYIPAEIELSVRAPAGSGNFVTLSPRQPLKPAPSALGLVNFSRGGTSEVDVSQVADSQVFQINANVVQTLVPTRNGDVESVDLRLVNTGSPTPLTLTLRGNTIVFGTSTVTVPSGTSIVTFPFPIGTNISTTSALRLDFNTTTTLGVRYSSTDVYAPGSANFLPTADIYFVLRLRGDGSWRSPLPLEISSESAVPLSVTGSDPDGTTFRLSSSGFTGVSWLLTATSDASVEGPRKFRIKPALAGSPAGLTMDSTGNVGINRALPLAAPLHVGGNLAVDGSIVLPINTRQYNVAAAACSSLGSAGGLTVTAASSVTGAVAGQNVSITAAVNLPNGATMTKLRCSLQDAATENVTISLLSLNISTGVTTTLRAFTTTGSIPGLVVTTLDVLPTPAPVDNATNAYIIRASWTCPGTVSNITIRSLGVEYTVTSPLP